MRINPADVQEGDVLLYHGTSLLSKIIMTLDGGDYSHSGIIRGGEVTEALGDGINHRPVAISAAGAKFVDVYRFTKDGKKLGDPQYPTPPLSAAVQVFEAAKNAYAYDEILLLALLCSTRRLSGIMGNPALGLIVRNFLDSAMELLANLISAGRKPVICSEMVFRCFDNATPSGTYTLVIRGADVPSAQALAAAPADPMAAQVQAQAAAFLQNYSQAALLQTPAAASGPIVAFSAPISAYSAAISAFAVANFVTPHDLQDSPNLQLAGTLNA